MNSRAEFESIVQKIGNSLPLHSFGRHPILVAVSGGPDSMLLLESLRILFSRFEHQNQSRNQKVEANRSKEVGQPESPQLIVVHVHHHLRDASADEDAELVREYCQAHRIDCVIRHLRSEVVTKTAGQGGEGRARQLRYQELLEVARSKGARYIATGHHADDQIETVFQRVLRGTSIRGLAGIKRARVLDEGITLIRPMLGIHRQEINQAITQIELRFRTDPTNLDGSNLRGRLREKLLPKLREEFSPGFDQAIAQLAESASEYQALLDEQVNELWEEVMLSRADPTEVKPPSSRPIVWLRGDALRAIKSLVLRALLVRIWEAQDWSLQAMDRTRWLRCETFIREKQGQAAESVRPNQPPPIELQFPIAQNQLALPNDLRLEWHPRESLFSLAVSKMESADSNRD